MVQLLCVLRSTCCPFTSVAPRGNLDPDSEEEISSSPWGFDSMRVSVKDRVRDRMRYRLTVRGRVRVRVWVKKKVEWWMRMR
jgi:hypothetical protein